MVQKNDKPLAWVCVGASAGGLSAFKSFLASIPEDSQLSFVLIQHMDPTQESYLERILQKFCKLPVQEVKSDTLAETGTVYIISPNSFLTIEKGVLIVRPPNQKRGQRTPVDHFLRTLAIDQKERAVGIVLSGTGSDGTLGLAAIAGESGLTIAQAPGEAEFPGMPQAAIDSGTVDLVCPTADMVNAIMNSLDDRGTLNQQLNSKIATLEQTINELQSLITNSDLATLVLDTNNRVLRFTPESAELFNLVSSDVGQPLTKLSSGFEGYDILEDCKRVLETLTISEKEVRNKDGRWFFRRILPYRTQSNQVQGVVVTFFDITEIENAKSFAQNNEDHWRQLLQNAGVIVAIYKGADHQCVFSNRKHQDLCNRPNILNVPLQESLPELMDQKIIKCFDRVYETGCLIEKMEYAITFKRQDGSDDERWISYLLQPWYQDSEIPLGVMCIATDNTETIFARREAERNLRLFEATGATIPYGVWWCDREGEYQYVSSSFLELTNRRIEDIRNQGWINLLHPEDQESTKTAWADTVAKGSPWKREHRIQNKHGGYVTILAIGTPLRDNHGNISAWVGLNIDISERKQHELERDESTAQLNLALKAAELGFYRHDFQTNIISFDERTKEIFGLKPSDTFSYNQLLLCVHPDDLDIVRSNFHNIYKGSKDELFSLEFRIRPFNAEPERIIQCNGLVAPFHSLSHTNEASIIGTIKDVTEYRQTATNLLHAKEDAEAANRAKTAFLANMSHDIRTPLTAISGYSEILSGMLTGEQAELAKEMKNACSHLFRTLDSVLRFASMEGRGVHLNLTAVDLVDEANKAYTLFKPIAQEKNIHFKLDVKSTLDAVHVTADLAGINRIFANVIDNAIKFSSEGKTVKLSVSQSEEFGCIEIADQGCGMSKEFIGNLFNPFTQEREKLDEPMSGAGLGMSITKQLVDLMEGEIQVNSHKSKGTIVTVRLPLTTEEVEVHQSSSSKLPYPNKGEPLPSILICDDYPNTRRILQIALEGYPLDFAANVEELFDKLHEQDIILLDINLSGQNVGSDLLGKIRKLQQNKKQSRVIAFTAHALPGQENSFLNEGFDGYLAKPFTQEDLIKVIHLTPSLD